MDVRGRRITPISQFEPETKALINAMTAKPDVIRQGYINDLILGLKQDSIFAELDALYIYASHAQQATNLNWVKPTQSLVTANSPVWTLDRGYTGVTSSYLKLGITPSGSTKMQLNSNSFGLYVNQVVNEPRDDFGDFNSSVQGIYISVNNANTAAFRNANATARTLVTDLTNCFLASRRTGAGNYTIQRNAVATAFTDASIVLPTNEIYDLKYDVNGVAGGTGTTKRHAVCFLGSGNVDLTKMYNRTLTFLSAIGAN
jgi:hypothetical protein